MSETKEDQPRDHNGRFLAPEADRQGSPTSVKYAPGKHPNSIANLKPFPPGTNGNPHPGHSLTLRLRDSLNKPLREPSVDASVGELIVHATIQGALNREKTPLREVWDRNEGRVPLPIQAKTFSEVVFRVEYDEPSNDREQDA